MVKLGTLRGNAGLNDNESVLENRINKIHKERTSTLLPVKAKEINFNILKKMIHDDLK